MVLFETGFGLNAGLHFVHRQSTRTKVHLQAGYGAGGRQVFSATMQSGPLAKRFASLFQLRYSTHPNARFFGIGNGDITEVPPPQLLDPSTDTTAISTRYRHHDIEGTAQLTINVATGVSVQAQGAIRSLDFRNNPSLGDDKFIADVYDPTRLVGYEEDLLNVSAGIGALFDTRAPGRPHLFRVTPSQGGRFSVNATYHHGIGEDQSQFVHLESQSHYWFNLYRGDRVLVVGLSLESTIGPMNRISFVDLAKLGGTERLRGYSRDRFRDRIAALGTIEYNFLVQEEATLYTFVDAGRVWRDWNSISLDNLRVGFGGGLRFHRYNRFIARLLVASTRNGGISVNLLFNPIFWTCSGAQIIMRWPSYCLVVFSSCFLMVCASPPRVGKLRFKNTAPVWFVNDRMDVPKKPKKLPYSTVYDIMQSVVVERVDRTLKPEPRKRALNVNSLGEVPNSTWFTNRIGRHDLTLAEIARGPNRNNGPDLSKPLRIQRTKMGGSAVGFIVKDARGGFLYSQI